MTQSTWKSVSNLKGRDRSTAVLEVDQALLHYHASRSARPRERAEALEKVTILVDAWFDKKSDEGKVNDDNATGTARRLAAMNRLRTELIAEKADLVELGALKGDGDDIYENEGDVRIGAAEAYRRAVRLLQRHLALNPTSRNQKQLAAWDDIYAEATQLRVEAMALADAPGATDSMKGAARMARGLKRSIAGFSSLAYEHFNRPHPRPKIFNFGTAISNIAKHHGAAARYQDDQATKFLQQATIDMGRYSILAGGSEKGPGAADMSDEQAEVIGLLLATYEGGADQLAYQGTGGKGNTGFAEAWQGAPAAPAPDPGTAPDPGSAPDPAPEDTRSDAAKGVESTFGSLSEGGRSGDLTSGVNDMGASLGGLGGGGIEIVQAIGVLKNADASPAQRRAAYATLVAATPKTLSNVLKFVGGALTTDRGATGSIDSTSFGFEASGTDVSTDVKIAGDFSGLFAGVIDSIKKAIDTVRHFKDRSDKESEGGFRRTMEGLGSFFQKAAGTLTSLANNAKMATKLGYQIAGGGQVASDAVNASAAEFMKHGVPGMNLAMAVLDAVHQTYKLVRIGIRRSILSEKMEARAVEADATEMEAMQFTHGSLVKRTTRLGINLGHALAAIVGGGLNTSGIGMAPGMVISIASTAGKLGQVGARNVKQIGRDSKAEKRREKNAAAGDEFESFAEFRLRKRIDASKKGTWARFKTKIDLAVTYNWDKASANKAEDTRTVAFEILRMDDDDIYKAIGVLNQIRARADDPAKQLSIIEDALKKRD